MSSGATSLPLRLLRDLNRSRAAGTGEALRLSGWAVCSRLLVWAAALWTIAAVGVDRATSMRFDAQHLTEPFHSATLNLLLAPAARWDSVWYLGIAHSGYASRGSAAFFPLYPLLMSIGGDLVGSPMIAGAALSLLATGIASSLLLRLARLELGEEAARTGVLALLFFPTAFFFSTVYTESVFLALTVGAFYAARTERWALAGALGALAGATRSSGILLLLPLLLLFLYGPRAGGIRRSPDKWWTPRYELGFGWSRESRDSQRGAVACLGLVPLGLIAYLTYLGLRYGTPFAPFAAEHNWGRYFAGPFGGIFHALTSLSSAVSSVITGTQQVAAGPLGWEAHQLIDFAFLAFALAGLWMCWRRLPLAYLAYALVLACQALSYPTPWEPMESFSRYLLVIFPVFMAWGAMLAERPVLRRVVLSLSAAGLAAFSGLWGIWAWVG